MKCKFTGIFAMAVLLHFQAAATRVFAIKPSVAKVAVKRKLSLASLTKNIEFAFCKAKVSSADSVQLNELAQFLIQSKYAVALRGHADAIGSYVGNWKMSEARANAIKVYLLNKGVLEDRVITTAYGSTIPIANNKTSSGRQKNRRVEIRLKPIGDEQASAMKNR
jgi:outer membrane protein OmpA-like peptidoglycan-associated protein